MQANPKVLGELITPIKVFLDSALYILPSGPNWSCPKFPVVGVPNTIREAIIVAAIPELISYCNTLLKSDI